MQIVKGIVIGIYFIVCLALVILAMVQSKEDAGLSSTITGTSANNFFEKNKGNTKEGKQKKWTVILGIILVVLCIVSTYLGSLCSPYIAVEFVVCGIVVDTIKKGIT